MREFISKKLSDKVSDTRFGKTRVGDALVTLLDEEKQIARADAHMSVLIEDLAYRRNCWRMIWICAAGAILIWLAVFFLPGPVNYAVLFAGLLFTKGGAIFLTLPFGFATLGTYSFLRLWFPNLEDQKPSDLGAMSSFQYQSNSTKIWRVWLASCVVGVVNSIGIAFAFFYMTGQLEILYR